MLQNLPVHLSAGARGEARGAAVLVCSRGRGSTARSAASQTLARIVLCDGVRGVKSVTVSLRVGEIPAR